MTRGHPRDKPPPMLPYPADHKHPPGPWQGLSARPHPCQAMLGPGGDVVLPVTLAFGPLQDCPSDWGPCFDLALKMGGVRGALIGPLSRSESQPHGGHSAPPAALGEGTLCV